MLKEFKNGNLVIDIKADVKSGYIDLNNQYWIDNFYDNELTNRDFYFNEINGIMYLVNLRTKKVYDFSSCAYCNILDYFRQILDNGIDYKLKLYSLPSKLSKALIKDLLTEINSH